MKWVLQVGRGYAQSGGTNSSLLFLTNFRCFLSFFFGLVFNQVFGWLLERYGIHFGRPWTIILASNIDQQINRICGRFFQAFGVHFSMDIRQCWDLFFIPVLNLHEKNTTHEFTTLPMKSDVRALNNDT